jgi:uncharacterized protein
MRWEDERESDNVEDQRGMPGPGGDDMDNRPGMPFPGGDDMGYRRGMSIPTGIAVGGIGGVVVVALVLLGLFFGFNRGGVVRESPSPQMQTQPRSMPVHQKASPAYDQQRKFVSVILASTEDVWGENFQKMGKTYQKPKLVLFTRSVKSACGMAGSAMGPFYCPGDQKVYLDFSFFEDMQRRLGVSGDFARAYVIGHEVGHHVQKLMGIMQKVRQHQQANPAEKNKWSVMLELQADCFAGVWAKQADMKRHILEPGDIEKGLNAASAIGDDRIQKRTRGYAVPDSFTHGSSEQRVYWFKRGFEAGDHNSCKTFPSARK